MSKNSTSPTDKIQKLFDLEENQDQPSVGTSNLKRLFVEIWKHKALLVGGNILLLVTTFAAVYEPRLLGLFIDKALRPKDFEQIKFLTGLFLVLQIVRVGSLITHTYIFSLLGQRVMQDLRMQLFRKLQSLPLSTFSRVPVGKLVTRVTNDISSLADMFSAGFVTILGNVLFALGIVIWLLVLNPRLALITFSVLPPLIWLSIKFSQKLKLAYRLARSRLSNLNAFFAENILGMKVIQLYNRQNQHLDKFKDLNTQYANAQFGSVRVFSLFQPSITMATGIAMALLIWYGGDLARQDQITIGFLTSYFAFVLSLFQPLREIADKWNIFLAGMASVERVFSILDWDSEPFIHNLEQEVEPYPKLEGKIEFRNVWFAYEGENWVLKDFSFVIKPGQKIGIVGPTGSGKTTLISLLLRFYDPQKGEILLDGVPLTNYDKRRLRASVGLIQQDVFLFSGSLAENMTLWRPFDPGVQQTLRGLSSFRQLENRDLNKVDSLQERGGNLSMGERQILAFARALHTGPRFWILDEATSNMDSENEKELEQLLKTKAHDRTVVTIAHRLASVRAADNILVLQSGHLIEWGSHNELMKKEGFYSKLYRYQELT